MGTLYLLPLLEKPLSAFPLPHFFMITLEPIASSKRI
jgi:hypothetical protein